MTWIACPMCGAPMTPDSRRHKCPQCPVTFIPYTELLPDTSDGGWMEFPDGERIPIPPDPSDDEESARILTAWLERTAAPPRPPEDDPDRPAGP